MPPLNDQIERCEVCGIVDGAVAFWQERDPTQSAIVARPG